MFVRNILATLLISASVFAGTQSKIVGIVLIKKSSADVAEEKVEKSPYGKYGYYSMRDHYSDAISTLCKDVSVVFLEPDAKAVDAYASMLDGLLIPGNTPDVDPALYGEKKVMDFTVEKYRDNFEIALLKELKKKNKPVLGICHGAQIMNVAFGGTLYQDLPSQKTESKINHNPFGDGNATVHEITVSQRAQHLFGLDEETKRYAVNSVHHQAIKNVASGFAVIAKSDDGVIEGIQSTSHPFFVGVQWHPEYELSKYDQYLIKSFCAAVHGNPVSDEKPHVKAKLL